MMSEPGMRDLGSDLANGGSRDGFEELGGRDGGRRGDVDERVGVRSDGGGFGGPSRARLWEFDRGSFGEGRLKVGRGGWEKEGKEEGRVSDAFFILEARKETHLVASCGRRGSRKGLYLYPHLPCRGFLG